jgi:uncharacterized damage-inducible protein DinB
MAVDTTGIERQLDRVRAAPVRIAAATAGVADDRLRRRTAAEPWSVNDVLAHVRAAADQRDRFIRRMATGEHVTLPYRSPRSELRKTDYVDRPFAENLASFTAKRAALVEWLEALPRDAWSRGARIRDRPETVASYVGHLTDHEQLHCDQIEALLR